MDNQPAQVEGLKKFITFKNIMIALGVVVLLEVLWAGSTLLGPTPPPVPTSVTIPKSTPTVISLEADKTTLKLGEKVTVKINISSNSKTDGTDLVISYDPNLLTAQTSGVKKEPVITGTIYKDYPLNSIDAKLGRITVSGITDTPGGVLTDGLFGSLVFVGRAPGIAEVSLQFSPGSTSDSNVTESGTGKDVLEKVEGVELSILP